MVMVTVMVMMMVVMMMLMIMMMMRSSYYLIVVLSLACASLFSSSTRQVLGALGKFNGWMPNCRRETTKTTDENKKENTMASWLKERRRAVGEMAQETMNNDPELLNGLNFAEADLLPGWTDGHQKELEFQRSKQEANRVEAYQDNLLIADDGVDEEAMKETVLETRVKEQKKDKDLIAARKRKEEVHHRNHLEMDWAEFSGQKVWLSADDANMEPRMK